MPKKPSNKLPSGGLTNKPKKRGSRKPFRPRTSAKKPQSAASLARQVERTRAVNQSVPQNNKISDRLWDMSSRNRGNRANLRATGSNTTVRKAIKTRVRKTK